MRCPKCGAFLEQGKVVCSMCGTNSTTYVPETNNNNMNNNNSFGSGGDFSNYAPPSKNNFRTEYDQRHDYRNATIVPVKNGEKDIFDFFSENKKILSFGGILLGLALVAFIGFKYYESKTKVPELEPRLHNLYYEVDKGFAATEGNDSAEYIKTGSKGSDCSITIKYGASTSGDHVKEFFNSVHTNKGKDINRDSNGNVINPLAIYTPVESNMTYNNATWHYLNLFYKKNVNDESATNLKYKYLTAMYKGYFYDIELVNNSNDAICGASLDNFAKSLQFIDTKDIKK